MKKILSILLLIVLTCSLCACKGNTSKATIDYGESKIYSKKDMDSAIKVLKKKFKEFDDCELHSIRYSSDNENSAENIAWVNNIKPQEYKDKNIKFTQVIMFYTNFHTPKKSSGSFNLDTEMEDYQWWFARVDGGEWVYISSGY